MNKLINKLDYFLGKYTKDEFNEKDKLDFLSELNYDKLEFVEYSNSTLLLAIYAALSTMDYKVLESLVNEIENAIDNLDLKDFLSLELLMGLFELRIDNDSFDVLFLKDSNYKENMEKLEELYKIEELNYIIKKMFMKNDYFDFDSYNLFLLFCNENTKIVLMRILIDFMEFRCIKPEYEEIIKAKIRFVSKAINGKYDFVFEGIRMIETYKTELNNKYIKFEKERNRKLKSLLEIKSNIISNKVVDVSFNNNEYETILLPYLYIHNNNILTNEYNNLIKINDELKNNSVNRIEKILIKMGYNNIDFNKIEISEYLLVKKLEIINQYIPEIKEFSNIMLYFINNIDEEDLLKIIQCIVEKGIDYIFILNNIELLSIKDELNIFIDNYNLLKVNKFNIKNVVKYDELILFQNNLKNIIDVYNLYGINFEVECYNYEFLKNDCSYIIDKFIEIGEYELIKNNPSLINENSNIIIKRCILYKNLGNSCVNKQNKLNGILRKEDKFIIEDKYLDDLVIENSNELIDKDLLNILNEKVVDISNFDLSVLDSYKINEQYYECDGMYISRNKILKNINCIMNSDIKDYYNDKEILYNSILFNYPKLVTLEDVNNIKRILGIKIKKLV